MYRKDKGTLLTYAPGDGAISFVWLDENGKATGRRVRRYEINYYLRTEDGKSWLERGFKIAWDGNFWRLIPDIVLIPDGVKFYRTIDGLRLRGNEYRVTILHRKYPNLRIGPHEIEVKNHPIPVGWRVNHPVRHLSTLMNICFYLNNPNLYVA
jgi:hypothetical protein